MSKTVSAALKTHLGEVHTTLATLWRITRIDAVEYFCTDHDVDITFNGDVYLANTGMLPSSVETTRDTGGGNLEVTSFLEVVDEADIAAGLLDGATLDIFLVNYEDLTMGYLPLAEGHEFGPVAIDDRTFRVEARAKSQRLKQSIVEVYNKRCRAVLGDSRCQVDLLQSGTDWTQNGTVSSVTDRQMFVTSALSNETRLVYGKLTWDGIADSISNFNTGLSMEVKDYDIATNTLTLFEAMPYAIAAGDDFTIVVGCDKLFATCRDLFLNHLNFRGEPWIPGEDALPLYRKHRTKPWDRGGGSQ